MKQAINRREFLKVSALAGGGFAIGVALPAVAPKFLPEAQAAGNFVPNQWLQIRPDNSILIIVDKSEMGQGVATSMPMLVAEELDADWSKVGFEYAPAAPQYANPLFGVQGTGGSTSVRAMFEPLRRAGAVARDMLVTAAADEWKVDKSAIRTENSMLIGPGGKRATYGQMAGAASNVKPADPKSIKLKDPSAWKIIGKPVKRLDAASKVTGQAKFGMDVKLPGLLTALVARSPVVGGKVASFNADKAKAVKGVRNVIQVKGPTSEGVAVLADTYWAAKMGRDALEVTWDEGANAKLSSASMRDAMMQLVDTSATPVVAIKEGDVAAAAIAKKVDAVYELPYLLHAPMEPMNLTVWVKADGVDIYGGTQGQGPNQFTVAAILGIKPEQVRIQTTNLGGGFGRRFAPDALIEALQLSKASGAPVKLVFSREDDVKGYYYRPAAYVKVSGGIDSAGKPVAMHARTACSSVAAGSGFEGALVKDRLDVMSTEGIDNWPYACPNKLVEWTPYEPGVRVWFWRSVGNSQNAFVAESYIDELAAAAGKDPFEFRRALLDKHPRHKAALELAAQKAGWGTPLPKGHARGIAVAESFGSYVAEVAEVSIENGAPRVHRVVIAADVGTVINPDTVAAQMEGAMVFGLSAALYGRISLKDGKIEQSNFHDYPILRIGEMPKVEVYTVASKEPPGGVGEPGTPPIAPAVANALFALTGKRQRTLPLST